MAEAIVNALRETGAIYLGALRAFLPRVLATLSIVVAGGLIALVLRALTRRVLGLVRFNALARRTGAAEVLRKAELPAADVLVARVVFWLVFLGFLLSSLGVLGFKGVEGLLAEFLRFIPRLLVAVAILVLGLLAANFAWRATLLAAVNANLPSARLVSALVRVMVVAMVAAMALEQLAVARTVVLTAFAISFGAVMLAVAIAVGIGAGPTARRIIEQHFTRREGGADGDAGSHL
jgi:hypothetical protein